MKPLFSPVLKVVSIIVIITFAIGLAISSSYEIAVGDTLAPFSAPNLISHTVMI